MEGWKGYYFTSVSPASAALQLNLEPAHKQKLATCWMRIQKLRKAHNWEHPDD